MNLCAILTGDLVRSSAVEASRYPALLQALQRCCCWRMCWVIFTCNR